METDTKELTAWNKLNTNQKRFIEYRLAGMGRIDAYMKAYDCKNRDSAKSDVSRLMLTNADVREELNRRLDACVAEAMETLRGEANRSAEAMAELRDYGNREYSVRLAAAKDILDRVGLKGIENHQVEQTVDTAPGLVIIGVDASKYPPPLGEDEQA